MASATCPHNCRRCRAIELGLAGRPLNREEFILVQGGVIVPEAAVNGWQADTAEAALAVDLCEVEYREADRTLGEVFGEFLRVRSSGLAEGPDMVRVRGPRSALHVRSLEAGVSAAQADLAAIADRLLAARSAHAALVRRDEHQHRLARSAADEAEQERARLATAKSRHRAGRQTLRALAEKITGGD